LSERVREVVLMRRPFLLPATLAAAVCAVLIPATGASAKPPHLAITAIVGNSTTGIGAFCGFDVVVTYSGPAKHSPQVVWTILHADGSKAFGGSPVAYALGPSPFTPPGLSVVQGSPPTLPAGSYIFDVQLLASGKVVSEQHTGPFPVSGLPAPTGCPPLGQLATYP
jgi:hypothetical protein